MLAAEMARDNIHCSTVAELFNYMLMLAQEVSAETYNKEKAVECCRRFCLLYCTLAEEALSRGQENIWQPKPKMHLLQELVEYQSPQWGSPKLFWCYRDESWCGFWARASHRRGGAKSVASITLQMLDRFRAKENDAFD